MRKKIYLLFILLFLLVQISCVSRKKIVYFQNDEINQSLVSNSYKTVFKPDDLLNITVTSEDLESTKPFNLPAVTFSIMPDRAIGQPAQQLYLIDDKGYIDFPILGKLKIAGLTRAEVISLLKSKISPGYVKNPTINIRIANFKITVLGNVNNPGTYTIPNERVTILEAIGLAGDLSISGKRNTILVHREEAGKKNIYQINLLSKKLFTSPIYYLQQNDLVYVEPNKASMQRASYNPNIGMFASIASVIISLLTILTR